MFSPGIIICFVAAGLVIIGLFCFGYYAWRDYRLTIEAVWTRRNRRHDLSATNTDFQDDRERIATAV